MNLKYIYRLSGVALLSVFAWACADDKYEVPTPKRAFQDDCLKRSVGPNIVNDTMMFAYAMALPADMGKIVSAQVEASIPGATNPNPRIATYLDHRAYSTDGGGNDKPVQIGNPSITDGGVTKVTFTRDTFAVTLRYFYKIPQAARGQQVNFTFSALDSNGETVSMNMGPYQISSMDKVLNLTVADNAAMYISIADMAIYTAAQAAANPDKIDLVYLYRALVSQPPPAPVRTFGHALVAPANDPSNLPGVTLPAGVNKNTKLVKTLNLRDHNLNPANQFGETFIDDVDFKNVDMSTANNFAINLKADYGTWVETQDGKFRAFILILSVDNTAKNMKIGIKRLQMF